MAKAKSPAVVLSERLLDVLKTQRDLGPEGYPLSLRQLAVLTEVQADSEIVREAVKKGSFKAEAVVAIKGNLRSSVALKSDAAQLAESPELLEQLLELTCTEAVPAVPISALQKHLASTDLKKLFKESTEQRMQEKSLPTEVDTAGTSKKPLLFLKSNPPLVPEVQLAKNLVRVLEAQRDLGGDAYPVMLKNLVALTNVKVAPKLVKMAIGLAPFNDQAVLGAKQGRTILDCPVALKTDREALASSLMLLKFLLQLLLKPQARTVAVDAVAEKASPDLAPLIKEALQRNLEADTLPTSLGWMWIGGKQHLFFVEDVHITGRSATAARPVPEATSATPATPAVTSTLVDFGRAFEEAFQRLNRESGNHNFVRLIDLRTAVPVDRNTFDGGLRDLRMAGRYGLAPSDGRHGPTTHEQLEAGITEDGTLLLYVSRKSP